ncbi:hypothetical protein [Bdellovibrio reynosensis]|uniref:Uncharacterized protein n=1 Tax=Bdellovibrio reynosensis TaxID=2835041 RepID=A0ABY4CDE6_9BACT|nr:hypothetical protein [Bdellovibrio reynosensis]UOF02925.1 hypothetical protein MNR06_08155 [Bdellovibrio reynosensis]
MSRVWKGFEAAMNISNNNEQEIFIMMYKLIGAVIIAVAGVLAYMILQDEPGSILSARKEKTEASAECVQLTPAQQLAKMINDDFNNLAQTQQLPAAWNSIATVELRMNSQLAKTILGKERPSIQRVKDGTSYLELEIVDLPDEENPGIIIQASLFDIKTKNKIFEIGRTYTMNDLNKVTPEPASAATPTAEAKENTQSASPTATPAQQSPQGTTTTEPASSQDKQATPGNTQEPKMTK